MGRFEGKVALVTGGNSGIGLSAANAFAKEGAKVVISGRNQKTIDEAVESIGGDVLGVKADVSKLAEIDYLVSEIQSKYDKLDVLFLNAGIATAIICDNFMRLTKV